jgi:hypothetical protein
LKISLFNEKSPFDEKEWIAGKKINSGGRYESVI